MRREVKIKSIGDNKMHTAKKENYIFKITPVIFTANVA